ncbi:MAG: hypothetical protein MJK04_09940 [Psychrosphaera sp.]|nr:hypothetical protein [Psychrosphaera sp.]
MPLAFALADSDLEDFDFAGSDLEGLGLVGLGPEDQSLEDPGTLLNELENGVKVFLSKC